MPERTVALNRKGRAPGREPADLGKTSGELADLRERVAYLESCLCDLGTPYDLLGLTAREARLFGALVRHQALSRERMLSILYSDRASDDRPEIKIVDVLICKIRSKLDRHGVAITTVWGRGYSIEPETKTKVFGLLAQLSAEGAHAA